MSDDQFLKYPAYMEYVDLGHEVYDGFERGVRASIEVLEDQRIAALSQRHAMGVGELDAAIKALRGLLE